MRHPDTEYYTFVNYTCLTIRNSGTIRLYGFPIYHLTTRKPRDRILFRKTVSQMFHFVVKSNSIIMDLTGVLQYLLFMFVVLTRSVEASLISTKVDLCGPIMELVLDEFDESSATIAFATNEYTSVCKLKITAPETHVISMNIIETIPEELQGEYRRTSKRESCHLNVFQHGNPEPVWSGDPCSHQTLSNIDLLRPEVILEWTPPVDSFHTRGKKVLVTAVGRGDVCKDSLQHTCMTIGYEPLFCVSKYLLCDGNQNCPRGATKNDEDDKLCKITWSIFFKQFKHPEVNERILNVLLSKTTKSPKVYPVWQDWTYWKDKVTTAFPTTTTVETQTTNIESLSAALSHYGPWGYILLGLLICGTVLMFCGVWECFRKPKPPADATQEVNPNTTTTTTVLIIQEDDNSPPRYDDLEPPSYSTLFPTAKEDGPVLADNGTSPVMQLNDQSRQILENSTNVEVSSENSAYAAADNVVQELTASENITNHINNSSNPENTGRNNARCESASTNRSSSNATDSSGSETDPSTSAIDSSANNSNFITASDIISSNNTTTAV